MHSQYTLLRVPILQWQGNQGECRLQMFWSPWFVLSLQHYMSSVFMCSLQHVHIPVCSLCNAILLPLQCKMAYISLLKQATISFTSPAWCASVATASPWYKRNHTEIYRPTLIAKQTTNHTAEVANTQLPTVSPDFKSSLFIQAWDSPHCL